MNTNYHTNNIKDTIKNQKSGQNDKIEKIGDTNKNGKHHEVKNISEYKLLHNQHQRHNQKSKVRTERQN